MAGLISRLTQRRPAPATRPDAGGVPAAMPGAQPGAETPAVPIVGIVRFSVLFGVQGFFRQTKELSLAERRDLLFAPERMEMRFRWFEALTLPSLLAQADQDWRAVVLHSSELPEPWRGRLMDLLAPHRHIVPVAFAPDEFLGARVRAELAGQVPRPDAPVVTFRLDDDDALSSRYLERLRALVAQYPVPHTVFSFTEGHVVQAAVQAAGQAAGQAVGQAAGQAAGNAPGFRLVERFRKLGIGCGQAWLGPRDDRNGVFNFGAPHTLADRSFPTVSDGREPMFLVAAHEHNDVGPLSTRHQRLAKSPVLGPAELREKLGDAFAHLRLDRILS